MSRGNPGDNQGQGRQNGGADRGGREPVQNVGQQIQEGAVAMGQRVQEGYGTAREEMSRRYRHAEGMMARNPASSVLIGFGIGFGLGLVLTTLLAQPEEDRWAERYLPDRLRNAPDSLHALADSVRGLPDAIAKRMPSHLWHS